MFQSVNRSLIPNKSHQTHGFVVPHSELHLGHDFVSASGPENQALTQTSHPIIEWQHLAITTGGWMGDAEQIWHERFSFKSLFSPNGIFESFVRLKIRDVLSLMSAISACICIVADVVASNSVLILRLRLMATGSLECWTSFSSSEIA